MPRQLLLRCQLLLRYLLPLPFHRLLLLLFRQLRTVLLVMP
jgi:hypothetical protein